MYKGVGLGIVCISCVLLGFCAKVRLKKEVEIIGKWRDILLELQEEIAYGKYPLAECFYRLAERRKPEEKLLFIEIYEGCMESGEHPLFVFDKATRRYLKENGVSKGVQEEICACLLIGNMQEDMQCRLLEQSILRMGRLYDRQMAENREKEKLSVTLGVMGGFFFFLFFI